MVLRNISTDVDATEHVGFTDCKGNIVGPLGDGNLRDQPATRHRLLLCVSISHTGARSPEDGPECPDAQEDH